MGWFDWYLQLFDGEPTWLVVLVSVILLAGVVVIVEKVLKWSIWIFVLGIVAGLAALVVGYFWGY